MSNTDHPNTRKDSHHDASHWTDPIVIKGILQEERDAKKKGDDTDTPEPARPLFFTAFSWDRSGLTHEWLLTMSRTWRRTRSNRRGNSRMMITECFRTKFLHKCLTIRCTNALSYYTNSSRFRIFKCTNTRT